VAADLLIIFLAGLEILQTLLHLKEIMAVMVLLLLPTMVLAVGVVLMRQVQTEHLPQAVMAETALRHQFLVLP
jgi:hypothetical protein